MGETVKALDLHIAITGTSPEIWRDLRVPADTLLNTLHLAIQRAFGWKVQHLHMFSMPDGADGRRRFTGSEDTAEELGWELTDGVTLEDVLGGEGSALEYEYDFGDSWDHAITVTGHALAPSGQLICTGGGNRGPVEDSGGIGGYHQLCGILADKAHPEHEEMTGWYEFVTGERASTFDPAEFDLDVVNQRLDRLNVRLAQQPPTPEEMAAVVYPAKWLLQRVGKYGLELTKDGYLKPAVVSEIMTELGWSERWIGKINREAQTPPVLELHARMREWKLLRKYKGRLVRTPAGRKVADDDAALWNYLAGALSAVDNPALQHGAGLVTAWTLEDQMPPYSMIGEAMAQALMDAGFRMPDGGPVPEEGGRDIYLEIKRGMDCLSIFDLDSGFIDPRTPTEAGTKFLLELERRQNGR
ncbi:plasmid pRiA4b ORF-3 family protein [Arthrobacter monumenti]